MSLKIQIRGIEASWDTEESIWTSREKELEELLNYTIPPEIHSDISLVFKPGGVEHVVLLAAQRLFGITLHVLEYQPTKPPSDKPGVIV